MLHHLGVFHIPSHYILKRWTRDANDKSNSTKVSTEPKCERKWYSALLQLGTLLSKEGSISQQSYNFVHVAMRNALENCRAINNFGEKRGRCDSYEFIDKQNIDYNLVNDTILDPEISKTKGAPKRLKSGVEKGRKKKSEKSKKVRGIIILLVKIFEYILCLLIFSIKFFRVNVISWIYH